MLSAFPAGGGPDARTAHRIALAGWVLAWVVAAAGIALTAYTTGDPDSRLYAGISAHLVPLPIRQWIAPEWWGYWGIVGPYHEHPVGMFVVPAALGRLGYPAPQAAFAVNALYQVISFALIVAIARAVVPIGEARALGWLLQLLPIAFVFRVRANQEYAVLAALLFAVYAAERARTRSAWALGMLAGFTAVLLVKGVFAFMVPLACAAWLFARGPIGGPGPAPSRVDALSHQPQIAWLAVLAMPMVGALVTWAYESAYIAVTGRSFLEIYRARQVPEGALTEGSPFARVAYTFAWYLGRLAWFAFPWSLVAGGVTIAAIRRRRILPGRATASPDDDSAARGAWFAIVTSALLLGAFSIAHRKADRYLFPAYFILAAPGVVYALRRWPRLAALAQRLDRPWIPPLVYVVLFLLRLVTRGKLPEFTFWRT